MQLIDGTRFSQKMKKSLNNKRNELTDGPEGHIARLTELYGNFQNGERATVQVDGESESRVVSRIFESREFGFLKVTVERPLRMNFEATKERLARLEEQSAFASLSVSKKRKDAKTIAEEEAQGQAHQEAIRAVLRALTRKGRYMDRALFLENVEEAAKARKVKLPAPVKKAILNALGERDRKAEICCDADGNPEPDSDLRDTENIPLPAGTTLPLPMHFGPDQPNDDLVALMTPTIFEYMRAEVLPHVPDAWVDYSKTKVGYEIPINRHFYVYKQPRPLVEIENNIAALEREIATLLKGMVD